MLPKPVGDSSKIRVSCRRLVVYALKFKPAFLVRMSILIGDFWVCLVSEHGIPDF
jgi:hypothetical protein